MWWCLYSYIGFSLVFVFAYFSSELSRYCLADDRLLEAVKFLDLGKGAGWELLQVEIVFKVFRLSITLLILATFVCSAHLSMCLLLVQVDVVHSFIHHLLQIVGTSS